MIIYTRCTESGVKFTPCTEKKYNGHGEMYQVQTTGIKLTHYGPKVVTNHVVKCTRYRLPV